MTSCVRLRAFDNAARLPFAMLAGRQEYLPRLRGFAEAGTGTDAAIVDSSADCPRNEMIFEHLAPSCYPFGPFLVSLEQGASASRSLDELPAEDMHRAVLSISEVYAEICETAERLVASSPRQLGHGKKAQAQRAYSKIANGMSAGG